MKIARVFPTKTSYSPTDQDAYFDVPGLFTPKYDEVHISVTFTWDMARALFLARQWKGYGKVLLGGVAIDGESKDPMKSGMYLKKGVTITSRGCPNGCSFCMINNSLRELKEFPEGNIVQDNNILACSDKHRKKVWTMLKTQKRIDFKGGLEPSRVTSKIAEDLRSLSIRTLWLACDTKNALKPLKKAVKELKKVGFTRSHLYCYCLIGKNKEEEKNRLESIWSMGCMPFAQLYRDPFNNIRYSQEWKQFQRLWSRPAIIRSRNK